MFIFLIDPKMVIIVKKIKICLQKIYIEYIVI